MGSGALTRGQQVSELEMAAARLRVDGAGGGALLLLGAARIISPVGFHEPSPIRVP